MVNATRTGRRWRIVSATVHNLSEARRPSDRERIDWTERLVTRAQLADHLGFSSRWVSQKVSEGMPHLRMGGSLRFQVSVAAAWLLEQENSK